MFVGEDMVHNVAVSVVVAGSHRCLAHSAPEVRLVDSFAVPVTPIEVGSFSVLAMLLKCGCQTENVIVRQTQTQ